jgi:hypothetical protein
VAHPSDEVALGTARRFRDRLRLFQLRGPLAHHTFQAFVIANEGLRIPRRARFLSSICSTRWVPSQSSAPEAASLRRAAQRFPRRTPIHRRGGWVRRSRLRIGNGLLAARVDHGGCRDKALRCAPAGVEGASQFSRWHQYSRRRRIGKCGRLIAAAPSWPTSRPSGHTVTTPTLPVGGRDTPG